jgi:hypothetical protein
MRRWTWSLGVGVVVVAFLIATRSAKAEAPSAGVSFTPIESATPGSLFNRLASPLGAAHSSTDNPIQAVALFPRKSVTLARKSGFRPTPPNIHTHPPKKSSSWWPFGHK